MPVMDGYEAVAELRKTGYTKPIVALTAHAMREERLLCLSKGFSEHIAKPVDRQEMVQKIFHLVSLQA